MSTWVKAFVALFVVILVSLWGLAWYYRDGPASTFETAKKMEPFSVYIMGHHNRIYIVFGPAMQNDNNVAFLGHHRAYTIVVIKCPVNLVFRGNNNIALIDSSLRNYVNVEDNGKSNVYTFSD